MSIETGERKEENNTLHLEGVEIDTSSAKTIRELLEAMPAKKGAVYQSYEYQRGQIENLVGEAEEIAKEHGKKDALEAGLKHIEMNTAINDELRDKARELLQKEYGAAKIE